MVLSIARGDDIETCFAQIQIFFARSNTNLVCWVVETMGSVHYISLPKSQKVSTGAIHLLVFKMWFFIVFIYHEMPS